MNANSKAVAYAKKFFSSRVLENDVTGLRRREHYCEHLGQQLENATRNPDTNDFEVLVMLAVELLRKNERMPDSLAFFAADVLEGKRKRPTKRGPDKYSKWERDYRLYRTIQEIVKAFGLAHYTNNELSEKMTAAEIVSQATGIKTAALITIYKRFHRDLGGK